MSIELTALLAKAVAGKAIDAGLDRAKQALSSPDVDPLEAELSGACKTAWRAFELSLKSTCVIDPSSELRLDEFSRLPALRTAVACLLDPDPRPDIASLWLDFQPLRPLDSEEQDFLAAWRALAKAFTRAVAASEALSRLVQNALAADQAQRLRQMATTLGGQPKVEADRLLIESYLKRIGPDVERLDTRGFYIRPDPGVVVHLRDVFVEPALVDVPLSEEEENTGALRPRSAPRQRHLGELVAESQIVVVLGDPGSGKTTLMKALASALCEGRQSTLSHPFRAGTLPIFLPLRRYASQLHATPDLQLITVLSSEVGISPTSLEAVLGAATAVVLLDGLDEVFDSAHQQQASDQVSLLASRYPATRFIVTSRPSGYEASPIGPARVVEIAPFDEARIIKFFMNWTAASRDSAASASEELQRAVLSDANLKQLARTPLLCALIALVYHGRSGELPQKRAAFYQAAVQTLCERWERVKSAPKQMASAALPSGEVVIQTLACVAWRGLADRSDVLLSEQDLHSWVKESLEQWPRAEDEIDARDFVRLAVQRLGILQEEERYKYRFVHLSVHEYFACRYMLDQLNESELVQAARRRVHNPMWAGTLSMVAGAASQAQATVLIRDLLDRPTSSLERYVARDLRKLLQWVADGVAAPRRLRAEIAERVVDRLSNDEFLGWSALCTAAVALGPEPVLIREMSRYLGGPEGSRNDAAFEYFEKLGCADVTAREELLSHWPKDPVAAFHAAHYLSHVWPDDELLIERMRNVLNSGEASDRTSAAMFFETTQSIDENVQQRLEDLLTDEDRGVFLCSLNALATLEVESERARYVGLARLAAEDGESYYFAIRLELFGIAEIRPLLDHSDPVVRRGAVECAAHSDNGELLPLILPMLDESDPDLLVSVLWYLLITRHAELVDLGRMLHMLASSDSGLQEMAVRYARSVGDRRSEVVEAVSRALSSDANVDFDYFTEVGVVSDEVYSRALQRLNILLGDGDKKDLAYRSRSAMQFLTKHATASTSEHVAQLLVAPTAVARELAAGYFSAKVPDVRRWAPQLRMLLNDPDPDVQRAALEALAAHGELGDAKEDSLRVLMDSGVLVSDTAASSVAMLVAGEPSLVERIRTGSARRGNAYTVLLAVASVEDGQVR